MIALAPLCFMVAAAPFVGPHLVTHVERPFWERVMSRAAHDLDCPEEKLELVAQNRDGAQVRGCDRFVTYLFSCTSSNPVSSVTASDCEIVGP